MIPRILLQILLVPALLCAGLQAQQKDAATTTTAAPLAPPNPALLYWQAIAFLPDVGAKEIKLINEVLDAKTPASDPSVAALLDQCRKSFARFARAASTLHPCVWGTTFDEGPLAPMPHLPKLQLLSRLALVNAASHFTAARHVDALQWITCVHRAARHTAADPLLTTAITQYGLEQQTIRLTASHLLSLPSPLREAHLKTLSTLPPLCTVREAMRGEHQLSEWMLHMVLGIEQNPGSEKALLDMAQSVLQSQAGQSGTAAAAAAKQTLSSLEEWKRNAGQARSLQTALATASEQPWPEFEASLQKIRTDFATAPPALLAMLPGVTGAKRKELECATLSLMLQAALTQGEALKDGPLPETKDTFSGDSILITREGDAIQLSMKQQLRGKSLTLRVAK